MCCLFIICIMHMVLHNCVCAIYYHKQDSTHAGSAADEYAGASLLQGVNC